MKIYQIPFVSWLITVFRLKVLILFSGILTLQLLHICSIIDRVSYSSLRSVLLKLSLVAGPVVTTSEKGTVTMHGTVFSQIIQRLFEHFLYIPKLGLQLISVSVNDMLGYTT